MIVFEGMDGCGKSSQIEPVAQVLRAMGLEVVCAREPGGTPLAEKIRSLVLFDAMDAQTEAMLVFAARRDHFQQVISPALVRGAAVICDRFVPSSYAYQGSARGVDLTLLQSLQRWSIGDFEPDLVLWFDVSPEEAARRRSVRSSNAVDAADASGEGASSGDRFEREALEFFARVRQGYEKHFRGYTPGVVCRIDASQSIEQVTHAVSEAVSQAIRRQEQFCREETGSRGQGQLFGREKS
jgi:dTMP kinase